MSKGHELWDSAPAHGERGGVRSANAMRFYALARMLAEAESAWLTGDSQQSMQRLRMLQAHCEKMIAELGPVDSTRLTLAVSAERLAPRLKSAR
jgi:hypothetical protein